jgi:hypothetical protein
MHISEGSILTNNAKQAKKNAAIEAKAPARKVDEKIGNISV